MSKKLFLNKFELFNFGYCQPFTGYALSFDYISKLKTREEFIKYLNEVFREVPKVLTYINFEEFKNNLTKETVNELDKLLGQDFEDMGDCGYASYSTTNRYLLLSEELSHCCGEDHYYIHDEFTHDSTKVSEETYHNQQSYFENNFIFKEEE